MVNVNLGAPYLVKIDRLIADGYAGNRTEVLRQGVCALEEKIAAEEEARLVAKGIDWELRQAKGKMIPFEKIKAKYGYKS